MSKYNANVLIGNWFYDLILAEEKAKQNLANSDLEITKSRKMFLFMLKEIPLTFPVVGLSYGAVIQIVSPEMPTKTMFKLKEKQGIALGVDINFRNVRKRSTFACGDQVIGTGLLTPCSRNVWTLVPEDKSKQGKELRFGDAMQIQIYNSNPPLYLEAPTMSPSVPKGECGHVVPKLISVKTTQTRFKVVNIYPQKRYETEGMVVPAFEPVAIIQSANSASLAVEPDFWFPTYFGMECEVSVHTFIDNRNKNKPDPRNFCRLTLWFSLLCHEKPASRNFYLNYGEVIYSFRVTFLVKQERDYLYPLNQTFLHDFSQNNAWLKEAIDPTSVSIINN